MTKDMLAQIAITYGTPTYVFDLSLLEERIREIRMRVDPKMDLCYAMKANPFITAHMAQLVDRIEVCSPGEMYICMKDEIPPEKILISGVNKKKQDIIEAIEYGVRKFTAESKKHMYFIDEATRELGQKVDVYLRLSASSQFGMSVEDLCDIIQQYRNNNMCNIVGIHYFVGTQRSKHHLKDIETLKKTTEFLNSEYSFKLKEIEYGPGLFFPYFLNDSDSGFASLERLNEILQTLACDYKVTVEMGRYFAAECGYYLTEVCDKKTIDDQQYIIVNGGIHHINYYGSMMGLKIPKMSLIYKESLDSEEDNFCICGSLCTTADVIIRSVRLKPPQIGDIFVFENAGAYSVTETPVLFLSRDMPSIVFSQGKNTWIKRRKIATHYFNH